MDPGIRVRVLVPELVVSSVVMDIATIRDYAVTMKAQADRLHDLIRRSGGPHAGPPLDVHTTGVLIRGIEAERVLHLCSIIDEQQTRITQLEAQVPTPL